MPEDTLEPENLDEASPEEQIALEEPGPDAAAEDSVPPAEDTAPVDAAPADVADEDTAADVADEELDPAEAFRAELRSLPGEWYVVHSYAGYEKRVKTNLENRIQSLNMEDYIHQVEVPMEEVVEIKNSQRKLVNRVRIPSYVLVRMDLTDESWGAVRHTPGVTGFVGNTHQPVPLTQDEVFSMLAPTVQARPGAQAPARGGGAGKAAAAPVEVEFSVGESVTV
ncbi:transcription termination/antitermination NusG family protein, partial [Georgenia sp. 10Sc9-8]|nr:transcription termination/antitermination NusG family protein [Georgenia halotolerans]